MSVHLFGMKTCEMCNTFTLIFLGVMNDTTPFPIFQLGILILG